MFPPLDPLDQLFAHLCADRAAGQQMFGTVYLGRLRQNRRAPHAHQKITGHTQSRIGGDPGIAIGTAALQADGQL